MTFTKVSRDTWSWHMVTMWPILCPQKMILLLQFLEIPQDVIWSQCGPFYALRKWSCSYGFQRFLKISFGHNVAHFMPLENNLVMILWNAMKILHYVTAIMHLQVQYGAFIFVLLLLFCCCFFSLQRCSDWMHCIAEELKSSAHWILRS